MVTMYSVLRDRYSRGATLLTLLTLFSSIVLATVTFLPEAELKSVGVSLHIARLIVGAATAIVLFASVAELVLKWRERVESYRNAAHRLAQIKAETRELLLRTTHLTDEEFDQLAAKFNSSARELPGVPDRQFVSLKAYHLRKVRLSQMCDHNVGCPVWILRARLRLGGVWSCLRGRSKSVDAAE
jgi:hypothetical protein